MKNLNTTTFKQNKIVRSANSSNSDLFQDNESSSSILNSIISGEAINGRKTEDQNNNGDEEDTGCMEIANTPEPPKGLGGGVKLGGQDTERSPFLSVDEKEANIDLLAHHNLYLKIYGKEYLIEQAKEIAINNPDVIGPVTVDSRGQIYQGNAFYEALKAIGRKQIEIRVIDLPDGDICQLMILANSIGSGKSMETLYKEIKELRSIYINKQGQKPSNTEKKEKYRALQFIASKVSQSETTVYRLEIVGDVNPAYLKRISNSRKNANDKYTLHAAYKHCTEFRRKRTENPDPESSWNYWAQVMTNPENELTVDQVMKLCEASPKKLSTSNYNSDEVTIVPPVRYDFTMLPKNVTDEDVFIRLMQHHNPDYLSSNMKHIKLLSMYRKVIDKLIHEIQ